MEGATHAQWNSTSSWVISELFFSGSGFESWNFHVKSCPMDNMSWLHSFNRNSEECTRIDGPCACLGSAAPAADVSQWVFPEFVPYLFHMKSPKIGTKSLTTWKVVPFSAKRQQKTVWYLKWRQTIASSSSNAWVPAILRSIVGTKKHCTTTWGEMPCIYKPGKTCIE